MEGGGKTTHTPFPYTYIILKRKEEKRTNRRCMVNNDSEIQVRAHSNNALY
jgi:hypothetical protein